MKQRNKIELISIISFVVLLSVVFIECVYQWGIRGYKVAIVMFSNHLLYTPIESIVAVVACGMAVVGSLIHNSKVKNAGFGIGTVACFAISLLWCCATSDFTKYFAARIKIALPIFVMSFYWLLVLISNNKKSRIAGIMAVVFPLLSQYTFYFGDMATRIFSRGMGANNGILEFDTAFVILSVIKTCAYIFVAIVLVLSYDKKEKKNKAVVQPMMSQTEKILKLKSLLDSGAITQEEFDSKKKEILGL